LNKIRSPWTDTVDFHLQSLGYVATSVSAGAKPGHGSKKTLLARRKPVEPDTEEIL
jgi:hypothetical protein